MSKYPPRACTALILAIATAYGDVLLAQEAGNPDELPEVLVTGKRASGYVATDSSVGTKLDIPLQELPQSAQVITSDVIRDQGLASLQDVMKNVSGTNPTGPVAAQGAYFYSYSIRGFGVDPLTDGLPQTYGGADRATDILVNIERVDVLKGPAAVAYGASQGGSLGGVINLVTKQPLPAPRYEAGLTVDRYGSLSPSFDVTGPVNDDKSIFFRVTGEVAKDRNFIDHNDRTSWGIFPTLTFTNHHGTSVTFQAEYTQRSAPYYPGQPYVGGVDTSAYTLPIGRNYDEPGIDRTTSFLTARATLRDELNADWSLEMIALRFHGVEAYGGADILDLNSNGTINRRFLDYHEGDDDKTFDVRLHGRMAVLGMENKLLVGAEQQDYLGQTHSLYGDLAPIDLFHPAYGAVPTNVGDPYPLYVDHSIYSGLYAQEQLALTPALKLLMGARYSRINDDVAGSPGTSLHELTPSVGASYALTNTVSVFAGYARGVSPTFGFFRPDGPAPKPERSRQYEAGIKLALSNDLSANFALFNLEHQNVPVTDPTSPEGYQKQIGAERSKGVEFDLTGAVTRSLNVTLSYAYMDARVLLGDGIPPGDRLQNTPANSGRLFAVYRFDDNSPLARLRLGGGAFYASEREATLPNTVKLPGYATLDAMVGYALDRHTDIALNLQNLGNRRYFENAINFNSVVTVQPGAPFNAVLSLRSTW